MELNKKNIRNAIGLKEDLDYLIERFTTDNIGYVDIDSLKKSREEVEKDIKIYQDKLKESCPALIEGKIIRLSGGDGISYSERKYCYIKNININNILADVIIVTRGDYGNKISVKIDIKINKEEFIEEYNRKYHKDDISLEEWYSLIKYSENIPWPKEK